MNFTVTELDIKLSIAFGLVHGLFELTFLILESYATKTSFLNYCIVCFNGRYEWVPYQEYLTVESMKLKSKKFKVKKNKDE